MAAQIETPQRVAPPHRGHGHRQSARAMIRTLLLGCGIAASVLYVAATILGAMRWQGYSSFSQTVSELFAIGAPSRSLVIPLFLSYSVLQIAFGVGVWGAARQQRPLHIVGCLIVVNEVRGVVGTLFAPIHLRGVKGTSTDNWHIILTMVNVACILLIIGFAATAFGLRFRLYSIGTILVLMVFGVLAGVQGGQLAANLPTPWLGVWERINIYAAMLWYAMLAITILRAEMGRREASIGAAGARRGAGSFPATAGEALIPPRGR